MCRLTLLDRNCPAAARAARAAARAPENRNRLMVVSAFDDDFVALLRILNRTNWIADWWTNCADAVAMLRGNPVPVVVCDADLPDGDWRSLLARITLSRSRSRLILTARRPDERLWAEALNLGAYDVLAKPFSGTEVVRAIGNAWHTWGARALPDGE